MELRVYKPTTKKLTWTMEFHDEITTGTPYRNYYSFWNRLRRFFYKTKREKEWHAMMKEITEQIRKEIDDELIAGFKSPVGLPADPLATIHFPDKPYL